MRNRLIPDPSDNGDGEEYTLQELGDMVQRLINIVEDIDKEQEEHRLDIQKLKRLIKKTGK